MRKRAGMKIQKAEPKFNPIIITIETQEEADLLLAVLARVSGGHAHNITYILYQGLGGNDAHDKSVFEVTTGSIRVERKDGH
jgi:hypothetical protein